MLNKSIYNNLNALLPWIPANSWSISPTLFQASLFSRFLLRHNVKDMTNNKLVKDKLKTYTPGKYSLININNSL